MVSGGNAAGDTIVSIEGVYGSDLAGDTLTGSSSTNTLYGYGGNDTLQGGDGDDWLDGGIGADTLDGGSGIDKANYWNSSEGITVDLSLTTAQVSAGEASGDILLNIENITGSVFADVLSGDANANYLHGFVGNDTLNGNNGDDELIGGAGADVLNGGGGNDSAIYWDSPDGVTVNLNLTTAQVSTGDASGDILSGIESIYGSNVGTDVLTGNSASNDLFGLDGNDIMAGGAGGDWINGGTGNDSLTGGIGNDTFRFDDISFGDDQISDFEDGLDKLSFDLSVADSFGDFVITGNGTTSVTVTQGTETIIVAGATAITLSASDFLFA